jgi:hypothetical protein
MVIPLNINLKDWSASLVVDFPSDDIPLLYDENSWKSWGNALVQCTSFSTNGAPATTLFKDWISWALAIFNVMSNF